MGEAVVIRFLGCAFRICVDVDCSVRVTGLTGGQTIIGGTQASENLTFSSTSNATKGKIILDGEDITELEADKRAKKGLFLSFQYPSEITGVTLNNFLRTAYNSVKEEKLNVIDFYKFFKQKMEELHIDPSFSKRYVNEGFSGGEKKRAEILQMAVLAPKYAILDETDSGTDVDALKIIGNAVNDMKSPNKATLIITHYYRILNYITPDKVHIMINGKIVKEGGKELAEEIENYGFEAYMEKIKA